jgi:hypothetical protein
VSFSNAEAHLRELLDGVGESCSGGGVLLLADKVILDVKAYDRLVTGRLWSYGPMALMIKLLQDEGITAEKRDKSAMD